MEYIDSSSYFVAALPAMLFVFAFVIFFYYLCFARLTMLYCCTYALLLLFLKLWHLCICFFSCCDLRQWCAVVIGVFFYYLLLLLSLLFLWFVLFLLLAFIDFIVFVISLCIYCCCIFVFFLFYCCCCCLMPYLATMIAQHFLRRICAATL